MPHIPETLISHSSESSKENRPGARPRRILYVHNSADIYGASRSLLRLCHALDRTRFQPMVLLPEEGPLATLLRETGADLLIDPHLSVITRSVFKSWRIVPFVLGLPLSAWRLRSTIRRHRIDLVHTNVGIILSSGLGARLAGVPHVWHIRDWYGEFGRLWKWYRRYILACSDAVLCVSHAIAKQFPVRSKVEVVHNGFRLEEFELAQSNMRHDFRGQLGISPDEHVIGAVGRIKFIRKGQEVLVRAAADLRDRGCRFKLLIVGAPSPGSEAHLPRLRHLVAELDLVSHVFFTGELHDPRPAYAALDVFVLPSAQPEPFAGVVMEAMSMAKPVIATAIGGSPDQVVDGETGYLVPPGDWKGLADKLLILLADSDLRKRMGEAGRERIRVHFGFEQMVAKFVSIYVRLTAR